MMIEGVVTSWSDDVETEYLMDRFEDKVFIKASSHRTCDLDYVPSLLRTSGSRLGLKSD
jgi:hypothetical protein